jgi:hypothetical protein
MKDILLSMENTQTAVELTVNWLSSVSKLLVDRTFDLSNELRDTKTKYNVDMQTWLEIELSDITEQIESVIYEIEGFITK